MLAGPRRRAEDNGAGQGQGQGQGQGEGEQYVLTGSFDGAMWCLNATSGAAVWAFETGGPVHSDPTVTPDGAHVYFGSYDDHVYKLATGF